MNHNVLAVEVVATQVVAAEEAEEEAAAAAAGVTLAAVAEVGAAEVIPVAEVAPVVEDAAPAAAVAESVRPTMGRMLTTSRDRSFLRSLSRRRPTSKYSTNWPTELAGSSS